MKAWLNVQLKNGLASALTLFAAGMSGSVDASPAPSVKTEANVPFIPQGSPIPGSLGGRIAQFTLREPVQQFADVRECASESQTPVLGAKSATIAILERIRPAAVSGPVMRWRN